MSSSLISDFDNAKLNYQQETQENTVSSKSSIAFVKLSLNFKVLLNGEFFDCIGCFKEIIYISLFCSSKGYSNLMVVDCTCLWL